MGCILLISKMSRRLTNQFHLSPKVQPEATMCVSSLCETSLLNRKMLGRGRGRGEARSLSFLGTCQKLAGGRGGGNRGGVTTF